MSVVHGECSQIYPFTGEVQLQPPPLERPKSRGRHAPLSDDVSGISHIEFMSDLYSDRFGSCCKGTEGSCNLVCDTLHGLYDVFCSGWSTHSTVTTDTAPTMRHSHLLALLAKIRTELSTTPIPTMSYHVTTHTHTRTHAYIPIHTHTHMRTHRYTPILTHPCTRHSHTHCTAQGSMASSTSGRERPSSARGQRQRSVGSASARAPPPPGPLEREGKDEENIATPRRAKHTSKVMFHE